MPGVEVAATDPKLSDNILLTQEAFDVLPNYSSTIPTGAWPGKQWKRKCKGEDNWWLGEYYEKEGDKEFTYINWTKITISEDGLRVDQIVHPDDWGTRIKEWREANKT